MDTTIKESVSVKEQCFSILESHPDSCLLYAFGEKVEILTEYSDIFFRLRTACFGSNFCLVYRDDANFRHAINVLVDVFRWIEISEGMSSFLYSFTKRES